MSCIPGKSVYPPESNQRDQITREATQRTVDQLNIADGGYHGWTVEELSDTILKLSAHLDLKISENVLDIDSQSD
jgi:hypothetical protein